MQNERGFTLVEVLVAFAILAVGIGVVFKVFGTNLSRAEKIDAERDAVAVAQSLLSRVGVDLPLADGEQAGEAGAGVRWRVRIAPYVEVDPTHLGPLEAHEVVVTVRWGAGAARSLTLTTLRIAGRG